MLWHYRCYKIPTSVLDGLDRVELSGWEPFGMTIWGNDVYLHLRLQGGLFETLPQVRP